MLEISHHLRPQFFRWGLLQKPELLDWPSREPQKSRLHFVMWRYRCTVLSPAFSMGAKAENMETHTSVACILTTEHSLACFGPSLLKESVKLQIGKCVESPGRSPTGEGGKQHSLTRTPKA